MITNDEAIRILKSDMEFHELTEKHKEAICMSIRLLETQQENRDETMSLNEARDHALEKYEEMMSDARSWHDAARHARDIDNKRIFLEHEKDCVHCATEHFQLARWLKELQSIKEKYKWVKIEDFLPPEKKVVLFQGTQNQIVGYWYSDDGATMYRALSGDGWETDCDFPPDVFEPIAWMNLPDFYEGDGDEKT